MCINLRPEARVTMEVMKLLLVRAEMGLEKSGRIRLWGFCNGGSVLSAGFGYV